jgi:hypothetical protein
MIRRQVIEVELAGTEADGLALQRKLADLCANWLGPELDEMLGRASPADEHWSIDRLVVEAGSFSIDLLESDFVAAVTRAIRREIADRAAGLGGAVQRHDGGAGRTTEGRPRTSASAVPGDSSAAIERRSDIDRRREAFAHFLATGTLPWWLRLADGNNLEGWLTASWQAGGRRVEDGRALLQAVTSPVMLTRLVRQFSEPFLEALVGSDARHVVPVLRAVVAEMAQRALPPQAFRQRSERLWQVVLRDARSGQAGASAAELAARLRTVSEEGRDAIAALLQTRPGSPARSPNGSTGRAAAAVADDVAREDGARDAPAQRLDLEEGVYVDCAGLVLLHPFLPRLFETVGLAEQDRLVEPDRAACLLHFLATGEERAPEHALVLPKLLCGLPLEAPAAAAAELAQAERDEAIGLLEAVIGHWDALGSTSVDALRGTFLVRPGKLSRRGDEDVLQVEQRSFDILLDKLPWGVGAVRLPWMKRILWVEWTI